MGYDGLPEIRLNQTDENTGVESLDVFELAFNAMHSGLILYNRDTRSVPSGFRISAINDAGLGIARLSSADEALGKDLVSLLPRAEAAGVVDLLAKVCESGATEHVPTLRYHDAVRGGTYRNSLYRIKPGVVLSVFDDITSEMSNLQRLEESEKRLKLLTNSISDGIFDLDFASDEVYLSPSWKSQLGYADHELRNAFSTWSERLHPDERDRQLQAFEDFVRSTDSVWDTEFRLRHRNGHYVWLHSRATALRDPANNSIQRLIGFHVNTDELMRKQHEARERLELIETISRVIPDSLFLLSRDGEVMEHYLPDTALLYRKPEYFLGKNIADFMPGRVVDQHDAAVEESLQSRSVAQFQYELEISGEKKFLESRLRVMPDGQRVAVVVRDVTRERAVESELEAQRRELEIFERVVAATSDCMALVSTDICFTMVNTAFATYLGGTPESLRGKPACEVCPALFAGENEERLKRAMTGDDVDFSHWQYGPEGRRLFSFTFSPFYEGNYLSGVIITGHDITQLHAAQAEIRRAAQVFSSASEAILTTDLVGRITDINPAGLEITGYSREQLVGKDALVLVSERHNKKFLNDVMSRVESGERWRGEVWNKRADGSVYPCQMTISQVYDENGSGDLQGYVGVFFDTTTQKQYEQRLELVANHDPLTGLPNRAQFWRAMERTIELSRRTSATFNVMFIDLDHFKEVNDTLGHAAGDELLCKVTQRLNGLLRANDILARVGGDEFVVLLPSANDNESASIVAEKIQQALLEPFSVAGAEQNIGVSIGICAYPDDGDTVDLLLTNADAAMYAVKHAGRSGWRRYNAEITDQSARQLFILNGLRDALQQDSLRLVYQPQYDLDSGTVKAVEALLRWPAGDTKEQVRTPELLRVAEDGGLVSQLDRWTLNTACRQLATWRKSDAGALRMIVNVSAASVAQPDFAELVEGFLAAHGIPADVLELQIQESTLHRQSHNQTSNLRRLAAQGVGLSIDAFATSYSSLLQLNTTPPVDRVSINLAPTLAIQRDPAARRFMEALLALANSIGIEVVIQGIESPEQTEYLRKYARLLGQGFLLNPPLDAQQCGDLVLRKGEIPPDR